MNKIATIGDNNPPSPFDEAQFSIASLREEASHWLDGAEVTTQNEADAIAKLLDLVRKTKKEADDARKAEAKPFDDGKKEVQARYKPLLENCDRIASVCKAANLPWLQKMEEQRRQEEAAARKKAEEASAKAQAALQAAAATDIAAKEAAEDQIKIAKQAKKEANKAATQRGTAKGGARAMSLRTVYRHEIVNVREFARWCWDNEYDALVECLDAIAKRKVDAKFHTMPGVVVHEGKVAV